MPALVHNPGFELPVYPQETPVAWSTGDIEKAVQSDSPTFVRRAVLTYEGSGNLRHALRLADTAIEAVAEALDTGILPYAWGLYKGLPPQLTPIASYTYRSNTYQNTYDSSLHPLVPDGYSLVAHVVNLGPNSLLTAQDELDLYDDIHALDVSGRAPQANGYKIQDTNYGQFAVNLTRPGVRQLCYADIEPRLLEAA